MADLVIASDVIEHLLEPDEMLKFIVDKIDPRYVVISTPDRNLLRYGIHNGPPLNAKHIREWSMPELHAYLSEFLEIIEHFISSAPQATQCVLGQPRRRRP
jgi:2-polyprenyl-3-methyl-5-hydroxy-6-metoxy-1,4-benzoquinol methylase